MKRLIRNTSYDQQTDHEVRIQQLERRFVAVPTHWAFATFFTPQSVSSGGTIIEWDRFRTTNPDVFSTSATAGGAINNTAGDAAIRLDLAGMVFADCWVEFESGTFYRTVSLNIGGGETDAVSNPRDYKHKEAFADASVDTDGNVQAVTDGQWIQCGLDSFPSWFTTQANVGSAQPDKDAIGGSMTVVLFRPSGVPYGDTLVY